ncbi:unnamed protein product [Ceutorhynchus assimilis]|uniref:Uncharacterized protein n=1 Tax=Ceutorhynchus assimilis TaxID=467358 RepID=A0A9N9MBB7_9CUCU|nr:unnamed protein product [Ceutorhynchus assimilis]
MGKRKRSPADRSPGCSRNRSRSRHGHSPHKNRHFVSPSRSRSRISEGSRESKSRRSQGSYASYSYNGNRGRDSYVVKELELLKKRLDRYEGSTSARLSSTSRSSRSESTTRSRPRHSPRSPPVPLERETGEDQENLIDLANLQGSPRSPPEALVLTEDVNLDDDILKALGEQKNVNKHGYEAHVVLKKRWEEILSGGLGKEEREALKEKYPIPNNIPTLKSPAINLEIKKAVPSITIKKDKFLEITQAMLGHGISAIGKGLSSFLTDSNSLDAKNQLISRLSDGAKLLTDVHHNLSLNRRHLVTSSLNTSIKEVIQGTPVDGLLFGQNLAEKIKAAKEVERSVFKLKEPSKVIPSAGRAITDRITNLDPVTSSITRKNRNPSKNSGNRALVNLNGIMEIKCLHKVHKSGKTLEEAVLTDRTLCVEKYVSETGREQLRLKRKHHYYYQVQGQLNICKKDICFFVVYINDEQPLYVDAILRDEQFWNEEMLPKLTNFYQEHMIPELVKKYSSK